MTNRRDAIWLRLLPDVRRSERERFGFFFTLAALLSAAQTLGLAGSEALLLGRVGAAALAPAILLASISSVAGSALYAELVGRHRNDRLFIALLAVASFALATGAVLLGLTSHRALPLALFAAFYVCQAVLVSLHYWTFAADFFDARAARRILPLLAAGGSAGGVLGGALAAALSAFFPIESLVFAWSGGLAVAALALLRGRRRLASWTPVGTSESDESSAAGLRGALRLATRSPLVAWLGFSVLGMVVALTFAQVLYLEIFARSFGSSAELAGFFGLYLGVSNGIEIAVAHALTPWLVRRLGVAQANLVHPLLTLASFAGLAVAPGLGCAVAARANRELVENALAAPIRALAYNALPLRLRGRVRALLEGVVFFAAMSLTGVFLLARPVASSASGLILAGTAAAALYALSNWRVRREYVRGLASELRRGRLELDAVVADTLETGELESLAAVWERMLSEDPRPPAALLDLAALVAHRGITSPVARQLGHPDPRVRATVLEVLVASQRPELTEWLQAALDDAEPDVRRIAASGAAGTNAACGLPPQVIEAHLDDPDVVVCARLARALGEPGLPRLRRMLASPRSEEVVAALAELPVELAAEALPRLGHPVPAVRAAGLACLVRSGRAAEIPRATLASDLRDVDERVREGAVAALAAVADEADLARLAACLADPARGVRESARTALVERGEKALGVLAPHLTGDSREAAEMALDAIARIAGPAAHDLLCDVYRTRVAEVADHGRALSFLSALDDRASSFLELALGDARERARWLAFEILERLADPVVVRSVRRALALPDGRRRADALELLSNLGPRALSERLAHGLEQEAAVEPRRQDEGLAQIVMSARRSSDRWLRLAATCEPDAFASQEKDLMDRLLALRRVPLFAHLSIDQLEAVNRMLTESEFQAGEFIVREGEAGNELFVLIEGEVQVLKRQAAGSDRLLSTLRPVAWFGEIAILDDAPRSASVVAASDARLLALRGERFRELILQSPQIAFEIFPALTARIRAAEARSPDPA